MSAPGASDGAAAASDEAFVGWCSRTVLMREPDDAMLRELVGRLGAGASRLDVVRAFLDSEEYRRQAGPWRRFVPPGHFYSPIPSAEDIDEHERRCGQPASLPGIDLREAEQLRLLERLAAFYPSVPFADKPGPGLRYGYANPAYSYADAIFLHTLLRLVRPRRLIEIGSGHSSAVTLDTNERCLGGGLDCTFIDPYPDVLRSLLTPADELRVKIVAARLQDVPLGLFDALAAGDVLFVDSTHVAKVGSDVNRIVFEILPRLARGVLVHVHDVFYPFDYPVEWLREGRAWNEQYVLRAFLEFNSAFRIVLFGDYVTRRHAEWFEKHMPLCLRNTGGSLWIERAA